MAVNPTPSATEKSPLVSQHPQKKSSGTDCLISCAVTTTVCVVFVASGTAGLVGLFDYCYEDWGLNQCTVLSSLSLGVNLITGVFLARACASNSNKTAASKKRNVKAINAQV